MDKNKNGKKQDKKMWIILSILIVLAVAMAIILFFVLNNKDKKDDNTLAYTDLIKEISYGNVEKVEMTVGSTTVKVKIKNDEDFSKEFTLSDISIYPSDTTQYEFDITYTLNNIALTSTIVVTDNTSTTDPKIIIEGALPLYAWNNNMGVGFMPYYGNSLSETILYKIKTYNGGIGFSLGRLSSGMIYTKAKSIDDISSVYPICISYHTRYYKGLIDSAKTKEEDRKSVV